MSTLATIASPSAFLSVGLEHGRAQGLLDKQSAVLKHIAQSERLAAVRPASRLEVRPRPEMLSTGVAELDALTGGIPRGCLSEICGGPSSGKSSVLLATMTAATQRGESCVLIDASDSFDPSSGAAARMDFNKLLWIRCAEHKLIRARTPLSPKSKFVETRAHVLNSVEGSSPAYKLEQVLKSTDLILQSGGFGLVALDLAGIPEKHVRRIPLASWFRFQRAIEHTKAALLIVSEIVCAQTCATLVMEVRNKSSALSHQPSGKPFHARVLKEIEIEAEIIRSRLVRNDDRKPSQSVTANFSTQAVRAG